MNIPTSATTPPPIVVRAVQVAQLPVLLEVIHAAYAEYEGQLAPPSGAHKENIEFSQITLGVRLQLSENTAFYTRLGYHIVGYGSHPGYSELTYMHMAKHLDRSGDGHEAT